MSAQITIYEEASDGDIRDGSEVHGSWSGMGGGGSWLPVGQDETNQEYRMYKIMNISALAGKTIISAPYKFYVDSKETDSGGPPHICMYHISDFRPLTTGSWNATLHYDFSKVIDANTTPVPSWVSVDVKTRLQAIIDASWTTFATHFRRQSPGNDDFFRVRAGEDNAYKAYMTVTYCSLPSIPTPATAQIIDAENIRINWTDNSSGESQETEFRIERSVDGGAYALLTAKSPDVTEHIDDTVSAGHTYKYRVRAGNQAGNSNWVETNTVEPTAAGGMQGYMNC